MKPIQWAVIVVLALMVGGITFLMVNPSGSGDADQTSTGRPPPLTFAVTSYPEEGVAPLATEVRQRGHHDFWFSNDSGKDAAAGLNYKGCTCSEVEMALAPQHWRDNAVAAAGAAQAPWLPPPGLDSLRLLALKRFHEQLDLDWPSSEAPPTVLDKETHAVVPAGALGRVRLRWRQHEPNQQPNISAELWMGKRGEGVNVRLSVRVDIVEPLTAPRELKHPLVHYRDLERAKEGERTLIPCYSLTRPSFRLKARVLREGIEAHSDPIEVGEPMPLAFKDLQLLGSKQQIAPREIPRRCPSCGGHPLLVGADTTTPRIVLSGYGVPLIVRAAAPDGTPIDWGYFRRDIELSSPDEGIEPMRVRVTGEVRGKVSIGSGSESGGILLGPFPRSRGKRGTILLQTDEDKLELELDAARLPTFLRARLSPAERIAAGHRVWKLQVEVPPNAARGEFPRPGSAVYGDSAVYVKTAGADDKKPRTIRIPVSGSAIEG
jgi:hypothetical protein